MGFFAFLLPADKTGDNIMFEYDDERSVKDHRMPVEPWEKLGMTETQYDAFLAAKREIKHAKTEKAAVSALWAGVAILDRVERRTYTQANPNRAETLRVWVNRLADTISQLRYETLLALMMREQPGPWRTVEFYTTRADALIAEAEAVLTQKTTTTRRKFR